ncbi:protein of unknown function (plasmid) [Paraburkholderia dioscoreae]|uniref:Uncharacterized protein n=1 Tax=Paraburkholderia dioscoreae TaxID=2604047 RepID=A0A5Q4YV29_9BURK|nr:protein of unknown function [Paraburkholderia dioscoreae]
MKSSCGGSHAFAVDTAKRGACARWARWATRWTPKLEWVYPGHAGLNGDARAKTRDAGWVRFQWADYGSPPKHSGKIVAQGAAQGGSIRCACHKR